jgi:hypothetical protein
MASNLAPGGWARAPARSSHHLPNAVSECSGINSINHLGGETSSSCRQPSDRLGSPTAAMRFREAGGGRSQRDHRKPKALNQRAFMSSLSAWRDVKPVSHRFGWIGKPLLSRRKTCDTLIMARSGNLAATIAAERSCGLGWGLAVFPCSSRGDRRRYRCKQCQPLRSKYQQSIKLSPARRVRTLRDPGARHPRGKNRDRRSPVFTTLSGL